MKKIFLFTIIAALPLLSFGKSDKRGVSENKFQYFAQLEALEPGVTWFYNWSNSLGRYLDNQDLLEYVPMCWNGNYSADNIREYCRNHPETRYLLGFNEPNFKDQANMTPSEAAAAWPAVQALAKELNLELVAPALNYSPDAPYNDPLKWMDEFVALVGKDAFDYTAIHAYGGFGVMSDLATKFHDRYGKDVWVTEFCYWPGESGGVAASAQISCMMESLEWLEKTEWIHRYAWFKATEQTATNFNLIATGKGEDPRDLTEQGLVYTYMSDFDREHFHPVNTAIPASEYISQSLVSLGSSSDTQSNVPIEVSQFSAGATLDYQLDVPKAGEYQLTLRVTGVGEPVRFDPNISVVAVNSDGSEGKILSDAKKFELPGDNETYQTVSFPLSLDAGKQTIRLKDASPYQPSGIRISSLMLVDPAGINDVKVLDSNKPVDVFTLQGVRVLSNIKPESASELLPSGIYIIGGKKIAIK